MTGKRRSCGPQTAEPWVGVRGVGVTPTEEAKKQDRGQSLVMRKGKKREEAARADQGVTAEAFQRGAQHQGVRLHTAAVLTTWPWPPAPSLGSPFLLLPGH